MQSKDYIDSRLDCLKIFQLPVDLALIISLTLFEYHVNIVRDRIKDRFSMEARMLADKSGLQRLIPLILNKCQPETSDKKINITDEYIVNINSALSYCVRYDIVAHNYFLYHQGIYTGALDGSAAEFKYLEDFEFGRAQLTFLLHSYRDQESIVGTMKRYPSMPIGVMKSSLSRAIRNYDIKELLFSVPDEIYVPIRKVVESVTPKPSIDLDTRCSNYSVRDYYHLWLEIVTLMSIYLWACSEKSKMDKTFNYDSNRVLQLSPNELLRMLTYKQDINQNIVTSILDDLILDLRDSRPDILVQPILYLPQRKILLISPSIMQTANWEVCLLRNWVHRHSDVYGSVVASKKERLANTFGDLLRSDVTTIATKRKLKNEDGDVIGDVNVAAFDHNEGLLALFEVKWIIEPDSTRETIKSDTEIKIGIEQVLRSKQEYDINPARFIKQIFPGRSIKNEAIKNVWCFVVGYGFVGLQDEKQGRVVVIDYSLSQSIARSHAGDSLRDILSRIIDRQKKEIEFANRNERKSSVKLAGFLFSYPGFGIHNIDDLPSKHHGRKVGRNDLCFCGSGLKYKNCCLPLASYAEDIV